MTLRDFLPTHVEGRNLSQQYVQQVGCTVQAFGQWHGKPVTLDEMSVDLVDEWIRSMLHRRKPTPIKQSTATWHREALMSLWRRAFELGATKNEPPSTKYTMPPGTTEYSRTPEKQATMRARKRRVPITKYVEQYQTASGCRDNSAEQYRIAAQSVERFAGRTIYVDEFCPKLVNDWLAHAQKSLSASTVRTRRNHVVALWRSAHAHGLCATAHVREFIRPVRGGPKLSAAWTLDEARQLIETARELEGGFTYYDGRRSEFWELVVRCCWDSALRLGDLLAAKQAEFNDAGEAALTQSKTGRPVFVRLLPKTVAMLVASGWRDRETLLPVPYCREAFRKQFEQLVTLSCLDGSLKKIRKSSATNVEMRFPGWGAIHLGHLTGFKTADAHYFDFRIIAAKKPNPEEL